MIKHAVWTYSPGFKKPPLTHRDDPPGSFMAISAEVNSLFRFCDMYLGFFWFLNR